MQDELLDVQEVAARLRVNPRTVLRMADRGELPGLKVARRWRFRSSDLDTYLQSDQSSSSESLLEEESGGEEAFTNREGQRKPLNSLDWEKEQLALEQQRLALQRERLDLHTKQIDYALETANKMVNMLYPDSDAKTKASLLETLLTNLLQAGNTQIVLPPSNYSASVNQKHIATRAH